MLRLLANRSLAIYQSATVSATEDSALTITLYVMFGWICSSMPVGKAWF